MSQLLKQTNWYYPTQKAKVKYWAKALRISEAEVVRRAIDAFNPPMPPEASKLPKVKRKS